MVASELGENLTDEEVDKIFQKVDVNNTGYITAEDFYAVMVHKTTYNEWSPHALSLCLLLRWLLIGIGLLIILVWARSLKGVGI